MSNMIQDQIDMGLNLVRALKRTVEFNESNFEKLSDRVSELEDKQQNRDIRASVLGVIVSISFAIFIVARVMLSYGVHLS